MKDEWEGCARYKIRAMTFAFGFAKKMIAVVHAIIPLTLVSPISDTFIFTGCAAKNTDETKAGLTTVCNKTVDDVTRQVFQ